MNEEQLIEFVNWLPSVVPEFKDATPDQIVQALNQMSESDEGQQMLSQLINTFQQSKQSADSQMFKKGGKLAAFVSKYGKGGEMCCKKKAILQGGMVNKISEKMQDGGELATNTSANTLSNLGLLTKAQEGKKINFFSDLSGLNDMKFVQRSNNGKLVEMAPTREELPGNKGIQSMGFSRMITGPEGQMDTLYFRTYPNTTPVELFLDNAKKKKFNSVIDSLLTRAKLPTKITK